MYNIQTYAVDMRASVLVTLVLNFYIWWCLNILVWFPSWDNYIRF